MASIDAAKVWIEPRTEKEKALQERETWRDMKTGCWYETETVPLRRQSLQQKDKTQREGVVLRAKSQHYFCDIEQAEECSNYCGQRVVRLAQTAPVF